MNQESSSSTLPWVWPDRVKPFLSVEIWTAHLPLLLGGLMLLAAMPFKWVNFALRKDLNAFNFSLLGFDTHLHWPFLSYGLAILLLIGWGFLLWRRGSEGRLAWVGGVVLVLALYAFLQIAFGDSRLLQALISDHGQRGNTNNFTQTSLPPILWQEPNIWPQVPTHDLWQRLQASWYFLGLGWYLAIAGSIFLLIHAWPRLEDAAERRYLIRWGTMIAVLLIVIKSTGPALGYCELAWAEEAKARGDLNHARQHYVKALAFDSWQAINLDVYSSIGELDALQGHFTTQEYQVYKANQYLAQNDDVTACNIFDKLGNLPGDFGEACHLNAAALMAGYGLQLFHGGAVGSASAWWERSLATDNDQLQSAFYLTRAYFLTGRYQEAIDLARQTLRRVDQCAYVNGLYCNIGDCYTRMADHSQAKDAYREGYRAIMWMNFRALSALVGI